MIFISNTNYIFNDLIEPKDRAVNVPLKMRFQLNKIEDC